MMCPVVMEKRRYAVGQFEGPLDLLLALIKDNRIDLYDIPIAVVTEQFLEYLDEASSVDIGDLSDFYRMAARLVHLKSRMMIPAEPDEDDPFEFEDPRGDLVEMLIEYQRFKKLSSLMEEKEDENEWNFERKRIKRFLPEEPADDGWQEVDAEGMLMQMGRIYRALVSSISNTRVLDMYEEVSVGEKLTLMEEMFERKGECLFSELVRDGSKIDFVCAFMAVLEAVKFKTARIFQRRMFGDIKICRCRMD